MPADHLRTDRLLLRPLAPQDASAIATALADGDVARWLSGVPEPYALEDAQAFLARHAGRPGYWGICTDALIGVVSLRPGLGLGYWLAQAHWGAGLMSEAVRAVLARHFGARDLPVLSGHLPGNTRSRGLLLSMGFRDTDVIEVSTVKAVGKLRTQRMQLTAANWRFARAPRIETRRLVLRPMVPADADAISALANDQGLARMLASVPHPFSPADALAWMGDNRWRGRPGFRWSVTAHDGTVMGMVALGGSPVRTMYWLGRAFWGRGLATEAMRAFLADMMPRLALDEVAADAFVDNPASHAVLRKLGFEQTGEDMARSKARLEPAPVLTYRKTGRATGVSG